MPEELIPLAKELVKLNDEVKTLERAIKEEQDLLISDDNLPEPATARRTELEVSLHRAQAELARIQTDYNIKVAEWKRKE